MLRLGGAFLLPLCMPVLVHANEGSGHAWVPTPLDVVPFALLLLCIAVLTVIPATSHWWEHNSNKAIVCTLLSLPVLWQIVRHDPHLLPHAGIEYGQFLTLIASLFIVAGGLHVAGNLQAKPETNTAIMAGGVILASFVGTTGAAMILIYPLLRANSERSFKVHTVVFFIFTVANAGGLLTPLGDPPLFLGYLRGIPFTWFAFKLWAIWAATGVYLLTAYYLLDRLRYYPREEKKAIQEDIAHAEPLQLVGLPNLVFLAAIVGSVLMVPTPYRECILWVCAVLSLLYSHRTEIGRKARVKNDFKFGPIIEVAVVFAGIFITMIPALQLLAVRGSELGVTTPMQYFWATGIFSSFLDNAPTFLVFLTLGMSTEHMDVTQVSQVQQYTQLAPSILAAISVGAVFMGANTYIGNAPNFMVKSVAGEQGVQMPSFFGYMLWSGIFLLPWFILVGFVFDYIQ